MRPAPLLALTAAQTWAYNSVVTTETNPPAPPSAPSSEAQVQGPQVDPPPAGSAGLDFDKADYAQPAATKTCMRCKQSIASEYYEVGGQVVCTSCRNRIVGAVPDKLVFLRALLFGAIAGAAGTLVWSLIIYLTGYELGLIAIIVGIGVGIAVRKGARGRGGWKYQTLAMVLTYMSITTSYVPIIFKSIVKSAKDQTQVTATHEKSDPKVASTPAASDQAADQTRIHGKAETPAQPSSLPAPIAILAFLGLIWGLALAAPFLAGASNIMGIIIIAIGLYEAWKYNRRVVVNGPFRFAQAPLPETAGPGSP